MTASVSRASGPCWRSVSVITARCPSASTRWSPAVVTPGAVVCQVKERPGRTPLSQIKLMADDPVAVEAQAEEIKKRYTQYFRI